MQHETRATIHNIADLQSRVRLPLTQLLHIFDLGDIPVTINVKLGLVLGNTKKTRQILMAISSRNHFFLFRVHIFIIVNFFQHLVLRVVSRTGGRSSKISVISKCRNACVT